jgi:hypothetical protein
MALDSKNNIKSVFVVPVQSAVAALTKMFPGATATGSVAVCDVNNVVLDATTVLDKSTIKIIKDRGANLPLQQVRLNLADLAAYTGAAYAPSTEQKSFIGYNGTSGSINGYLGTLDGTFYIVKLEHVPNAFAYGKRPANYKYGTYQSAVQNATQKDVSQGLVRSLVQNFKPNRTIDWRVKSEMTCDASFTGTQPTNLALTRYSKQATVTGTVPSVGDAIRIGELGSGSVNTDDGVYIVTAVNGTVITFNYAYQGESGTAVSGELALEAAGVALDNADYGIKITGIKQKYDVNRWRQYDKVRFNALLENFSSDTPVTNIAAFDGLGVYEQVANDEYISWGDEGQVFVDQVPPLFREQDAVVGGEYSPLVLGWLNHLPSLIGAGENKGQAILYMDDATSNAQSTSVATILDAWAALKGFSNQAGNLI